MKKYTTSRRLRRNPARTCMVTMWLLMASSVPLLSIGTDPLSELLEAREQLHLERQALEESLQNLESGARDEARRQWRESPQVREQLAGLRQLTIEVSSSLPPELPPEPDPARFDGEEEPLRSLLYERSQLAYEGRALAYSLREASAEERAERLATWRAENRDRFREIQQGLHAVGPGPSQPLLPPPPVPEDLPEPFRQYLTLRRELAYERRQLEAEYAGASPEVRLEAVRQWREANDDRFRELRSLSAQVEEIQ